MSKTKSKHFKHTSHTEEDKVPTPRILIVFSFLNIGYVNSGCLLKVRSWVNLHKRGDSLFLRESEQPTSQDTCSRESFSNSCCLRLVQTERSRINLAPEVHSISWKQKSCWFPKHPFFKKNRYAWPILCFWWASDQTDGCTAPENPYILSVLSGQLLGVRVNSHSHEAHSRPSHHVSVKPVLSWGMHPHTFQNWWIHKVTKGEFPTPPLFLGWHPNLSHHQIDTRDADTPAGK